MLSQNVSILTGKSFILQQHYSALILNLSFSMSKPADLVRGVVLTATPHLKGQGHGVALNLHQVFGPA